MSLKVCIYKPSKTAMQSGRAKTHQWILEYERVSTRKPDFLMGWQSSEDTLNQVRLRFASMEDAIEYAHEKGWTYTVLPPHERRVRPRNYADNFKYFPEEAKSGTPG